MRLMSLACVTVIMDLTVDGSVFHIDVVYSSVANVLNDSVACSNSEECFFLVVCPWLHVGRLDRQLGHNFLLLLFIFELIKELGLLKFSVLEEQVKGRLTEWNNVLNDVPKNTFREWSSGERACVSPSSVELKH